jgi:hypothetical protein
MGESAKIVKPPGQNGLTKRIVITHLLSKTTKRLEHVFPRPRFTLGSQADDAVPFPMAELE